MQSQNVDCSSDACIESQTEMVTLSAADVAAGKFMVNLRRAWANGYSMDRKGTGGGGAGF